MGNSSKQLPVILVVEDNPVDARLICEAISRSGERHEVLVIGDGEEAIDFFRHQGKFEKSTTRFLKSVLLDMYLPKSSGIEVLRVIRGSSEYRELPVVVISGSQEDEHVIQAHELGVSAFLRKPLSLAAIREAIPPDKDCGIH